MTQTKKSESRVQNTSDIGQLKGETSKSDHTVGRPRSTFGWMPVCLTVFLFLLIGHSCFAQGTTSVLSGKVLDQQGSVIRDATVTVVSDESGVKWTAKTNEVGNWQVDALIVGHYHFSVSAAGFAAIDYPTFELQVASTKVIDVTLSVGNTSEVITVQADTPLVDTSAAVSGTVLNFDDFNELPSATNNPIEFARLAPGVYLGDTTGGAAFLWSNASMSTISANGAGSSTNAVNYMLDGATDSMNTTGAVAFIPPSDALQEVRFEINAYDASIERTAAGTVNMTMKSGGKNFHGTLYERDENNIFNADTYQNNALKIAAPTVHMNEWGGTVGGPFWIPRVYNGKNKTFFFFTYDGIRDVQPNATGMLSLPTQAERNGDFSQSITTNTVNGVTTPYKYAIYDPATATNAGERQLFPNATIPSHRISGMAQAIMALIPMPNKPSDAGGTDSNNYLMNEPRIDKFSSYAARADQAWNNNHHSYMTLRYNNWWELGGDAFGPDNILAANYQTRINEGLTLNHAWLISPKIFAGFTGNVTAWMGTSSPGGANVDLTKLGFSSAFVSQQSAKGIPQISGLFSSIGMGDFTGPSYENDYEYEGRAFIQQIWRNHTLHYGAGYMSQQAAIGNNQYAPGYYNFTNIWTTENPNKTSGPGVGSNIASFLLGLPHDGYEKINTNGYFTQPFEGAYIQDDWRTTQKLTLDFGVRWDYQGQFTERHNKFFSRYDPNYNLTFITNVAQPAYAAAIGGSSSNLGVRLLQSNGPAGNAFVARGALLYAGVNGTSRSVADTQPKYIQPRVGFAYQLRPETVLRGGVGRFVQGNYISGHANQLGYSSQTNFAATNDNYVTPASTLDNPYPTGLIAPTGNSLGAYTNPGSITSFYNPDTKRQFTDDASLHLEQQLKDYLFEIGGVFEATYGLNTGGFQVNNPGAAAYHAAYDPMFDSTGRPVNTLPGDTSVTNPFKGAPYITTTLETNVSVAAYQLLRPNPLLGNLNELLYNGKSQHYALQGKVQRRMRNGFGVVGTFSWGKQMDQTSFVTNSVFSQKLLRQLSSSDRRFLFVAAPTYVLPFGQGKLIGKNSNHLMDNLIGGWELSAVYNFASGTPLVLPTNTAFFEGGDPGIGSNKNNSRWFDTSKFAAFPTISTTVAQLQAYPQWTKVTSLPGAGWSPTSNTDTTKNGVYHDFVTWSTNNPTQYGDVRNPYTNTWNIGFRKSVKMEKGMSFQMRADAFNALNHPRFGNISVAPTSAYFGHLNGSNTLAQTNDPRSIQLEGKLYF